MRLAAYTHWNLIGLGLSWVEAHCENPDCGEGHGWSIELTVLCWSLRLEVVAQ